MRIIGIAALLGSSAALAQEGTAPTATLAPVEVHGVYVTPGSSLGLDPYRPLYKVNMDAGVHGDDGLARYVSAQAPTMCITACVLAWRSVFPNWR